MEYFGYSRSSARSISIQGHQKYIQKDFKLKKPLVAIVYTQILQRFNPLTAGTAYIRIFISY